ncbi:hypothetical protein [Faecalibacillus intestinalis]|uniref:hypothetical protein n=1 Tax=Faecalibacillus intestinalis TaxID=1982626 RepID=UPI003520365B
MIKEERLQPIDKSIVTNFDNINKGILGQSFDPNNDYWVPYFCGNVGILYDKTVVDKNDLKKDGIFFVIQNIKDKYICMIQNEIVLWLL